jgi:hypothetical protein
MAQRDNRHSFGYLLSSTPLGPDQVNVLLLLLESLESGRFEKMLLHPPELSRMEASESLLNTGGVLNVGGCLNISSIPQRTAVKYVGPKGWRITHGAEAPSPHLFQRLTMGLRAPTLQKRMTPGRGCCICRSRLIGF